MRLDPKNPVFIILIMILSITSIYLARDAPTYTSDKETSLQIVESIEKKLDNPLTDRSKVMNKDSSLSSINYIYGTHGRIAEDSYSDGVLSERRYYSGKNLIAIDNFATNMQLVKREYQHDGRTFATDFCDPYGKIMLTEYYDNEGRLKTRDVMFLPPLAGTAISG